MPRSQKFKVAAQESPLRPQEDQRPSNSPLSRDWSRTLPAYLQVLDEAQRVVSHLPARSAFGNHIAEYACDISMRLSALSAFSFASFSFSQEAGSNTTCFWPDGSAAVDMYGGKTFSACTSTGYSQCCATNDVCLSNGLCFDAWQGELYRGACTDKSWEVAICPNLCTSGISLRTIHLEQLSSFDHFRLPFELGEHRAVSIQRRKLSTVGMVVWDEFGDRLVQRYR